MGVSSRQRRMRRKKALLIACGLGLVLVSFALCIVMIQGVDWVARFFTEPTLEAKSGRKYTPTSGVKRWIEKQDENGSDQE